MSEIFSKILKDKNGKVLNVGSKYKQPEWGAETAIVDILPETTFEASEDMNGMAPIMNPLPYELVGGNTYEVTYNGTNYSTVCYDYVEGTGSGLLYLGNAKAAGIEDAPVTDEPFLVAFFYGASLEEIGVPGTVAPLDGSTTFTLSIKGAGEIIHPIPAKYTENEGVLCVELSNNFTSANKTYDEIIEAISGGKFVFAHQRTTDSDGEIADYFLTLCSVDLQRKINFILIQGTAQYLKCAPDNTWSLET